MSDQDEKGARLATRKQDSTGRPTPSAFDQWKAAYCKAGYSPLRIEPGSKACRDKNWQTEFRPVLLNRVNPGYGIGLLMGTPFEDGSRLGSIDVDRDDLMRPVRALLKSPCERFGSKGGAIFVRTVEGIDKNCQLKMHDGAKAGECLFRKANCVIPPTIHKDTGKPYRWIGKSLLDIQWQDLPLMDAAKLRFLQMLIKSAHLPEILAGDATHDPTLRLVAQLAVISEDDHLIEEVVAACFPDGYSGDSLPELPRMIRDARQKVEAGEWRSVRAEGHDSALDRLNAEYAVVQHGSKVRVLRFDFQNGRNVTTFLTFDDFCNYHRKESVLVNGKPMSMGRWWTNHPQRRTYSGLTFRPDEGEVVDGRLNLWRGWGVTPEPGDWSLMRQHLDEVIAGGNAEAAEYILNWLAWAVQHPAERAQVALVLKGGRGTGKGTIGNAMCRIFGQHAVHISSIEHLAGRFNAHLRDTCLVFADEAYWPGDKRAEGTLKRLITEPTLFIEAKGLDGVTVDNMLHVLMASNSDWVVPAGEHERRFAVFQVAEDKRQDRDWFAPLYQQLENGGYAAMLHDLLCRELGDWHPRHVPMTEALRDQQVRNLEPLDAWLVGLLDGGVLPTGGDQPNRVPSHSYHDFEGRNPKNGLFDIARERVPALRRIDDQVLAGHLKKLGCKPWRNKTQRGWEFPPLAECRAKWEAKYPDWKWNHPDATEWVAGEDTCDEPVNRLNPDAPY